MKDKAKTIIDFFKTKKGLAFSLVFLAMLFNVIFLWSELTAQKFIYNDEIYHRSIVENLNTALEQKKNIIDFWVGNIDLGVSAFHDYQHLPHFLMGLFYRLTHSFVSLTQIFNIFRYLLLILLPVVFFYAAKRLYFDYLAAGFSALFCSLLSENYLLGLSYNNYLWRGGGIFPQLWAVFFFPLAVAEIYNFLKGKGRLFWSVLLFIAVALSQIFYGYALFLCSVVFIFITPKKKEIYNRAKKLFFICLIVVLVTSYFFIPLVSTLKYTAKSIYIPSWKWDSFGAKVILNDLFEGQIFDFVRFPSITILFFIGILSILFLKLYKKENYRYLLFLTIFSLFLYFGRPFWGFLLNLLPFTRLFQWYRFVGIFQIFSVFIVGIGLSSVLSRIKKSGVLILSAALIAILVIPVFKERINFYQGNKEMQAQQNQAVNQFSRELSEIERTIKTLPSARIYAGLSNTFGDYPYYLINSIPLHAILTQLGFDVFGFSYHSQSLSTDIRLNFKDSSPEQYNLFNIRYVLLHKTWTPASFYKKIKEFDNFVLYEVPTTGYFDLVDVPAIFYGQEVDFFQANLNWLSSSLVSQKQYPIVELGKEPDKLFGLPVFNFQDVDDRVLNNFIQNQPLKGEILQESVEFNKYSAQFKTNEKSYLLLKINYHPNWRVYVDSKEVVPVMLTPGFIGTGIEPGTHEVLFVYRLPFYKTIFLLFGFLILLILLLKGFVPLGINQSID